MTTKKIAEIAGLNLGLAAADTLIFSPGFMGVEIGGASIFRTAFGITAIVMSVIIFAAGNYRLIMQKEKQLQPGEIKTPEDCVNALKGNYIKRTFANDITTILEQIERFKKKKETINDILLQKFNSTEMSFTKFQGAVAAVENIFYTNVKSILNKINAFDEDDYNRIRKSGSERKFSAEFIQTKMGIYNEFISFVKDSTEDNEEILLKLDRFLLELSRFNSLDEGEIDNMGTLKEIDELINKIKFYK